MLLRPCMSLTTVQEADAKLMKLGKNHPRKLVLIDVLDRRRVINTAGPRKPKVAGRTGGSY
jgi:hypothetical protein